MDFSLPTTAGNLGKFLSAEVIGDAEAVVRELSPLPATNSGGLSFCASGKYREALASLQGGVIVTRAEYVEPSLPLTYLVVSDPQKAFAEVARRCFPKKSSNGISLRATIDPSAVIGDDVSIGDNVHIGAGCKIAKGARIHASVFVGDGVEVGEKSEIFPNVTILDRVRIGARVVVFPGTVIGADGFGLLQGEFGAPTEMPQLGTVVVEDDVRIGANCTIDRGTLGETVIGKSSKLDAQVHVGHNVRIGKNCILCAQVGLSGSVILEDGVVLAGQVGVSHHLRLGPGARVAGQSGVRSDLTGGEDYFGSPALPFSKAVRVMKAMEALPELGKRVRKLEKALESTGSHHGPKDLGES